MVISAWGTGYNARYQGIKDRCGFIFFCSTYWIAFFFPCVWNVFKCKSWGTLSMPLLKEEAGSGSASTIVLFFCCCWTKPPLQTSLCVWGNSSRIRALSLSHWCVCVCVCVCYHMYSCVCWDQLSPPSPPPIRDRSDLELKCPNKSNKNLHRRLV